MSRAAYILALLGGVLLLVFGLLSLIGYTIETLKSFFGLGFFPDRFVTRGLVEIISGIIAIIGSRYARNLVWAIILIVFGIIGGGFAGLLVIVGGILGLIVALTRKT